MNHKSRLIAFLATLSAIVVLSLAAAVAVMLSEGTDDVIAALGFISSAVTGLIGLIGTFRPAQGNDQGERGD